MDLCIMPRYTCVCLFCIVSCRVVRSCLNAVCEIITSFEKIQCYRHLRRRFINRTGWLIVEQLFAYVTFVVTLRCL